MIRGLWLFVRVVLPERAESRSLGRWHVSRRRLGVEGALLPGPSLVGPGNVFSLDPAQVAWRRSPGTRKEEL